MWRVIELTVREGSYPPDSKWLFGTTVSTLGSRDPRDSSVLAPRDTPTEISSGMSYRILIDDVVVESLPPMSVAGGQELPTSLQSLSRSVLDAFSRNLKTLSENLEGAPELRSVSARPLFHSLPSVLDLANSGG
jgi:hypothetical protein